MAHGYSVKAREMRGLDPKVYTVNIDVRRLDGEVLTDNELAAIRDALAPEAALLPAEEEADELLREASNPRTSGERLMALLLTEKGPIKERIVGNPSLPVSVFSECLRFKGPVPLSFLAHLSAWQNPGVTLALMLHPHPDHKKSALSVLRSLESHHKLRQDEMENLFDTVAAWVSVKSGQPGYLTVRPFAIHLAGLFGLP